MFKYLAIRAGLLGTSIYETQSPWTGPEELKQANYVLWSLPKGLKFLQAVPPSESPKVIGLMGIHDPDALCQFQQCDLLPLVQEWGSKWRDSGQTTYGLHTTG